MSNLNMVTGLDFDGEISSIEGKVGVFKSTKNESNSKTNTKYFKMDYDVTYFIRVVSGYVPYYSYYIPGQTSKISPLTLTFTHGVKTERGIEQRPIYLNDNGLPHPPEDAFCPMKGMLINDPKAPGGKKELKPIIRYATNIIDWKAFMANPNEIPPVWIFSSGSSVFDFFKTFRNEMRDYPVWDFDKGPYWAITKIMKNGQTSYKVDRQEAAPLPPAVQEALRYEKTNPTDPGPWNLREAYHPFKCGKKLAIDNGRNPLFFPENNTEEDHQATTNLQSQSGYSGQAAPMNIQQSVQNYNTYTAPQNIPHTEPVLQQNIPQGFIPHTEPVLQQNIPQGFIPNTQPALQQNIPQTMPNVQAFVAPQQQGVPVAAMTQQIQPTVKEEVFSPQDWQETMKAFDR